MTNISNKIGGLIKTLVSRHFPFFLHFALDGSPNAKFKELWDKHA